MPTPLPLESLPFRQILGFAMCSRNASRRNYPSRPVESLQIPLLLPVSYAPNLQKPHNAHKTPKYQLLLTHNSSGYQGLTEATENHTLPAY